MIRYILASHEIGRVFGIRVRVMYLLYLFILLVLGARFLGVGAAGSGYSKYMVVATGMIMLPFFVFLHELGHSLVAMKEGIRVMEIMLHPLGGVAKLQGLVPSPGSEIMIAIAGPFVNLLIATVTLVPLYLSGNMTILDNMSAGGSFFYSIVSMIFSINIMLAIFNFLPIFPMDGGRIATATAVLLIGPEKGVRIMGKVALVGVALLIAVGAYLILYHNGVHFRMGLGLILIASFLYTTGKQELQARIYASRYASSQHLAHSKLSRDKRQPWEMPEWDSEKGFVEPEFEDEGWLERRRREKAEAEGRREKELLQSLRLDGDRLLEKVNLDGIESLTGDERTRLEEYSQMVKDGRL